MNKSIIINNLIDEKKYISYLEIGTQHKCNFNNIKCKYKICVDPARRSDVNYDYNMTSDEFFNQNKEKFDIIFIDGLHTADQVEKDIINSLNILNENGSIIVHDTNPPTEFHQLSDPKSSQQTPAKSCWAGTVWKTIYKLRKTREDLIFYTFSGDFGVTVMQKGKGSLLEIDNPYYEYSVFNKYRKQILNIID